MTLTKLKEVIDTIERTVHTRATEMGDGLPPARRMDTTKILTRQRHVDIAGHVLYMCFEMRQFVDQGRIEKCMRWLGFAQAALFFMDWATIEELENMNKP